MASDETFRTGVFGFMCFIIVFGLVGNTISFVVWTFGKRCSLLPVSTYFRFLAFIDTFILAVPGVELLLYLAPFKLLLRNQNIVFCKCLVLLTTGTLRISSWTLVILSVEKTLRIFLPLKMQVSHLSSKWRTRVAFCILIAASLGMNIPNTIHSTMIDPPGTNTTESNMTQSYTAGLVEPFVPTTIVSAGDVITNTADTSTETIAEKAVLESDSSTPGNDFAAFTRDQFTAETTIRQTDENTHSDEDITTMPGKGDRNDSSTLSTTKDIGVTDHRNESIIVTQNIIINDTETNMTSQSDEPDSVTESTIKDTITTKLTTTILNVTQEAMPDDNVTVQTADSETSTTESVSSPTGKMNKSTVTFTTAMHHTEDKTPTKSVVNFTESVENKSTTRSKMRGVPGIKGEVTTLSLPVSTNTETPNEEQKNTKSKVIFNVPYCSFVPTQLEIFLDITILFFIPFTVFLICNTCILCRLFRRGDMSMGINDKQNKKRKLDIRNMTYHVVGLCIIHSVSTAPWSIWTVYRIYHVGADVNDHYFAVYDLLNAFAYLNSAANVVLYCLIGKDFRRDLKQLFNGEERKKADPKAEESCRKCEESTASSTTLTKYTSKFSIRRSYAFDSPSSKPRGSQTYTKK